MGLATILAVQSFKGGTGKSTVSANLAVTLARLGKRVAVIDLDLEGPGLHVIFGISDAEIRVTINDVLQAPIPIRDAVLDLTHRLGIGSGCLLFCPAGHRLEEILKMVDTVFNLQVLTALPFNSDVFENLSRGVFVLEHQKDPLTKRFTELAENMVATIDRALQGGESYDNGSTPQTVG